MKKTLLAALGLFSLGCAQEAKQQEPVQETAVEQDVSKDENKAHFKIRSEPGWIFEVYTDGLTYSRFSTCVDKQTERKTERRFGDKWAYHVTDGQMISLDFEEDGKYKEKLRLFDYNCDDRVDEAYLFVSKKHYNRTCQQETLQQDRQGGHAIL